LRSVAGFLVLPEVIRLTVVERKFIRTTFCFKVSIHIILLLQSLDLTNPVNCFKLQKDIILVIENILYGR